MIPSGGTIIFSHKNVQKRKFFIFIKEKIDRKLAGQSSCSLFLSIKEGYNSKKVTFDMQDGLEDKIDRLTVMMSKLAANKEGANNQLKPKIYQN